MPRVQLLRRFSATLRLGVRALEALGPLLLLALVNFWLPRMLPGDPLVALQDPTSSLYISDASDRTRLLSYYGLDRPPLEQFVSYLTGLVRGDLGWSLRYGSSVTQVILTRLPWTLALIVPALIVASVSSLVIGAEAAWRRGGRLDALLVSVSTLIRALPTYVIGIAGLALFSLQLHLLPLSGGYTPFRRASGWLDEAVDLAAHWCLPGLVLMIEMLGARVLLVRNCMTTVCGEPYLLAARARGLSEVRLRYGHALRNALLPFVTAFGAQLGMALSGAVFVENLFAYPGMGRLLGEAVMARDYPLLQGTFLVLALWVVCMNRATDLAYRWLDPRTRLAGPA